MRSLRRLFGCSLVGVAAVLVITGGGREANAANAIARQGSDEYEDERRAETYRFIDNFLDGRSVDEVAEDLVEVLHRTMDLEKLKNERRRREMERSLYADDEALLERMAKYVVTWVNTSLTPRSDDECRWNWGRWRCDPQCECRYKYRFGDYTPGRSCRLRTKEEIEKMGTCDPDAGNDISLLEKLGSFLGKKGKQTWRFTSEHVIPKTDKECRFALARSVEEKRMVCTPESKCHWKWKLGDVHPGRSCRLGKGKAKATTSQNRLAADWFGGEHSAQDEVEDERIYGGAFED